MTKFAFTSLFLRIIETGRLDKSLLLKRPLLAMHQASRDINYTTPLETSDGKSITAPQHQKAIAARCIELAEEIDVPEREKQAAYDVYAITDHQDRIGKGRGSGKDWRYLMDRLDSPVKHTSLAKLAGAPRWITRENIEVVARDLRYNDLNGPAALYWQKTNERTGLMPGFDPDSLRKELKTPPPTRAAARARLFDDPDIHYMDWDCALNEQVELKVRLADPFNPELPQRYLGKLATQVAPPVIE